MRYKDLQLYNVFRAKTRTYPRSKEQMVHWSLYNTFWFYSIELLPGTIANGQFPERMPLPARMLLRNCDLNGADCLDIGSMEGLIPVLMCRQGARRVLATDFSFHAYPKMAAVMKYYGVDFSFKRIGLLYDLAKKIASPRWRGFDLINLSGVLYHVFSPLHVLAGLRPLLRKGGLMIVSTNVINRDDCSMEFNKQGRLQVEPNTFWYLTVPMLDYMLRYFQLEPIDCLYYKYPPSDSVRYAKDVDVGYMAVVCRAVDDRGARFNDKWLSESIRNSWEYLLCDQKMIAAQERSRIEYRSQNGPVELGDYCRKGEPLGVAAHSHDTHLLKLVDRI
jgi:2-polyprenyl-3-methyl-5-hydroxy-6-metoxy-1,4-benzoquinol methylase